MCKCTFGERLDKRILVNGRCARFLLEVVIWLEKAIFLLHALGSFTFRSKLEKMSVVQKRPQVQFCTRMRSNFGQNFFTVNQQ